ncbi:MAG: asparagine synthase (glutamine-hydrolyzing) [Paucibacter sp.]|nr:asparagine synthase (glutamine-hydrolyzing) [Roseateles sp.]
MCGINGVVTNCAQGRDQLTATVARMNAATRHRGPDGEGLFADDQVALGHLRLSIIDLSEGGAQPMHSPDGLMTLVFNGEIYNYIEIGAELRALGHQFRSHSDTEVLLHAYLHWGEDCVQRFNGMWAFAIWDARRRRLFASRDRLGVKPLLYVENGGQLFFSSEVAGIQAAQPLREANEGKLHDFLAYGYRTNNGETFFKGLRELPSGHNLIWQDGRVQQTRYWSLPEPGQRLPLPADEAGEAFKDLLRDAVRLRFRSDVPVAMLQSGGIDSSVICTIVNDEIGEHRLGPDAVSAFTATHPGHAYDESAAVRELMLSCPHIRPVELTPNGEELATHYEAYVAAMQEPKASGASFAHWRLMQAIRAQGIKVVINGQGADEALAGYGFYIRGYRMLDLLLGQPLEALHEARAIRAEMGWGYASLAAQTAKAMLGRRAASQARANFVEHSAQLLSPSFRQANAAYLPDLSMSWRGGNLDRHLRSQIQDYGFNQILKYEDVSSMSQGIEIRSPFVDYRLMEFAFSLPDEAKFSRGVTKKILRNAFDSRVPHRIIRAKTKLGFATPVADWFAQPAMQALVHRTISSPSFQSRTLWRPDRVAQRLRQPLSGGHAAPAWRFLMVARWLEQHGIVNV